MPGLLEEIRQAHQAWHEQLGRTENKAVQTVTRTGVVSEVLYGSDAVYVRVRREGQTATTAPIRWTGTSPPSTGTPIQITSPPSYIAGGSWGTPLFDIA